VVEEEIDPSERNGDLLDVLGLEDAGVAEECREGFQRSRDVRVTGDGVDACFGLTPSVRHDGRPRGPSEALDLAGGERE
jgi:hypothetical protein